MKVLYVCLILLLSMNVFGEENRAVPLDLSENELGYFVSLSIPENQLVFLLQSAEKRRIPVYLSGLVNNTVEDTAKVVMYLTRKYNIKGFLIDPVRFDYYGINAVPALVKKCGQKFDVIFGNGDIDQALELMKSEGDCRK